MLMMVKAGSKILFALLLLLPNHSAAQSPYFGGPRDRAYNIARLRGLDKITARVFSYDVPVNGQFVFGTLEIYVRACRKTVPEERPESAAYLEILELSSKTSSNYLFQGWMFSSSPSLSALEHPVYDIWLEDCINRSTSRLEISSGKAVLTKRAR